MPAENWAAASRIIAASSTGNESHRFRRSSAVAKTRINARKNDKQAPA